MSGHPLLSQALWALLLTAGTVTLHFVYTLRIIRVLEKHDRSRHKWVKEDVRRLYLLLEAVLMLLLVHGLEAALWAVFYFWHPGGLPDFTTAFYFSLTSYATIGYGDVLLGPGLRVVGSLEGMAGTLMFGWSVALLVAVLQKMAVAHPAGGGDGPKP